MEIRHPVRVVIDEAPKPFDLWRCMDAREEQGVLEVTDDGHVYVVVDGRPYSRYDVMLVIPEGIALECGRTRLSVRDTRTLVATHALMSAGYPVPDHVLVD